MSEPDIRALIAAELEAPALAPVAKVPAPWSGLFLRTLSLPALLKFEEMAPTNGDGKNTAANIPRFAWLLASCVVDGSGEPMLTQEQALRLADRNGVLFMDIAQQALAANGFNQAGVDEQKKS